jgi:mannosyltransferase
VAAAAAVGLVTAGVGAWGLAHQGLWPDEAFSLGASRLDLASISKLLWIDESYNATYYLMLHFWQRWSTGEAWLRLSSVGFGVAAAITLYVLNRRLFGLSTATAAATLLTVNVFFVRYLQEVRAYAFALFFVVMASYCFVTALERRSPTRWVIYGIAGAAAIYAHLFSGLVIGAHMLSLAIRQDRPPIRLVAGAALLIGGLVTPLAALVFAANPASFGHSSRLDSIEDLFLLLTGGAGIHSRGSHLLLLGYFVACCAGLAVMARRAPWRSERRADAAWHDAFLLLWLGVPMLSAFLLSFNYAAFQARYLIVALPPLVTLAGLGISALPTRPQRALALAVFLVLSWPQLHAYYRTPIREGGDWRAAAEYVARHQQQGDRIIFISRYGRGVFEYYLERLDGLDALVPLYPYQAWGAFIPVLGDRPAEPTTIAAQQLGAVTRVWVVLLWGGFESRAEDAAPIRMALEQSFAQVAARQFGPSLEARLYERKSQ